ncbi:MAG: ATPase, T2SS/T4P/T4SS family [Candidatus Micrarchaeia archaeon]
MVLRFWHKKENDAGQHARSPLSFKIEDIAYDAKLEQVDLPVPRDIVGMKNAKFYRVGGESAKIGSYENDLLEKVKANVIDILAKGDMIDRTKYDVAFNESVKQMAQLPTERAKYLAYLIANDTVGYGPLSMLLDDSTNIEEIEINAPAAPILVYHYKYGRCKTNLAFAGEAEFVHALNKLIYDADKELNENTPIIDTQIANLRIHAQIKPYAINNASASIRIGGEHEINLAYLLNSKTTNSMVLAYLWLAIETGMNIVITGAPASGKTSLMNSLFSFVPRYQKIVTVEEEVNEVKFYRNALNMLPLHGEKNGTVSVEDQVINALRMRPDRIAVGEIRGREAGEIFSGANLGIPFMTTMHSDEGAISLLKRLIVKPMEVDPYAISMLDVSVHMQQTNISERKIVGVYEYRWLSRAEAAEGKIAVGNDSVEIANIVENAALDRSALSESKVINALSRREGISKAKVMNEIKRRAEYLEKICQAGTTTLDLVNAIDAYYVG